MSAPVTLFDRARGVSPGGVHSPVRAFKSVGGDPVFFASGRGAELVDVDGKRYIDFCQSFGPLILGHADPDAARAAHAAIDDGWSFGACEPYSLALAEWIVRRLPWVERIRFVSSSGELAAPTQGQAFFYFGMRRKEFTAAFKQFGFVR